MEKKSKDETQPEKQDIKKITSLLEEAEKKLEEGEKKQKEYKEGWQRALADVAQERIRLGNMFETNKQNTEVSFIATLLPVVDVCDAYLGDAKEMKAVEVSTHIRKKIEELFTSFGVEEIVPQVRDVFNPEIHEALSVEQTLEKKEEHTISKLLRKGYRIKKRIIRPAQVVVYELKEVY